MGNAPPTIFISYSHRDEEWKDRLVVQLGVLARQGMLEIWDDRKIQAGAEWRTEIANAVQKAGIAILLISAYALTSPFILDEEYVTFLRRRREEGLLVLPLILKPCPWKLIPWLAEMQARPVDGRPLSSGSEFQIDQDLSSLALEISTLISPERVATAHAADWARPSAALRVNEPFQKSPRLAPKRWPMPTPLRQELLESMIVRDNSYPDEVLLLINREDAGAMARLALDAWERYCTMPPDVRTLRPQDHYLISRHLFDAIKRNDADACRRRPFINPVHQYLSGMIRHAPAPEREARIDVLRGWLNGRQSVYATSRDFAAFELGMSLAHTAQPDLLLCVQDPNELEMVRYYGAMSLGMLGDRSVIDELGVLAGEENNNLLRSLLLHVIYRLQSIH